MEWWWRFLISIFLSFLFPLALKLLFSRSKLPPGPPTVPIFGNLRWLSNSFFDLEPHLRKLHAKYGPILTFRIGPGTLIFIFDHVLAHKALVQKGSVFSDRPRAGAVSRIFTSNQHNINSARYGPLWRILRRNLMSEILHPSRIKSYAHGRKWILENMIRQLNDHANSGEPVWVLETLHRSMFSLLLLMCFGQKLDETTVKEIADVHRRLLRITVGLNVFSILPNISSVIFRKRWKKEVLQIRHEQLELLGQLIRARRDKKQDHQDQNENGFLFTYADSLLNLELPPEGGRKLKEEEMVSLCTEFLNAGSDTTSTSLQWIMANLVKHQDMQDKLVEEMDRVVGKEAEEVTAEHLDRLLYLKAVVTEGLRRHPPAHFVLPHAVSEEVELEGYIIPKGTTVNVMVAEIGRNEKVWKEPMKFRPERFLDGGEAVDITGSREIKMMPFGVGRRICPGLNLAMLHLEYFLANLVREFEWKAVDGDEVDLAERQEFFIVMKKPLKAKIIKRKRDG
ncbi:hypothetical protein AAC387_Pa08g1208 [Persea americana]